MDRERFTYCTENTQDFDIIIGHIEDILVDENFHCMINEFMEMYWEVFDDEEENKFIYTDIFNEYTNLVENYINENLLQRLPSFSMQNFLQYLEIQKQILDGEVFDILFSLSDFVKFKESILDFKHMKEGKYDNLQSNLKIMGINQTY